MSGNRSTKSQRKRLLIGLVALLFTAGVMLTNIFWVQSFVDVSVIGYSRLNEQRIAKVKVINPTSRILAVMVDGGSKNFVALAEYEQEINGTKTTWSQRPRTSASPVFINPSTTVDVNIIVPTNGPSKVWINVSEVLSSPGTKPKDRLLLTLINRKLIDPVTKVLLPELIWNESANPPQVK